MYLLCRSQLSDSYREVHNAHKNSAMGTQLGGKDR